MKVRQCFVGLLAATLIAGCESLPEVTGSEAPPNYLAMYNEAMVAYDAGAIDRAEPLFKELTEKVPREADPWFRLGNIYARSNRPTLAVNYYQEAVLRKPDLYKAWHNMGVVQLQQAAKSFIELRRRIPVDDPLYARSERFTEGVMELLGDGGVAAQ